jgi:hypothetical protein
LTRSREADWPSGGNTLVGQPTQRSMGGGRSSTDRPVGGDASRVRLLTIEPVFGQLKFNRQMGRFQRRGRAACRSEWRLIAATHNLLKLHHHQIATAAEPDRLSRRPG